MIARTIVSWVRVRYRVRPRRRPRPTRNPSLSIGHPDEPQKRPCSSSRAWRVGSSRSVDARSVRTGLTARQARQYKSPAEY